MAPRRKLSLFKKRPVRKGGYALAKRVARTTRQSRIYYVTQKVYKTSAFQASSAGQFLAAFQFNIAGIGGNLSAFQQLYDQYSIRKIVYKIIPKFTTATTSQNNIVNLTTCLDYDDSVVPPDVTNVYQYQNCKMTRGNRIHTRVLYPCVNFIVDGGAVAGNSIKRSPWIDMTNSLVPHRGIKLGIDALPLGSDVLDYDIEVIYSLAFKNIR